MKLQIIKGSIRNLIRLAVAIITITSLWGCGGGGGGGASSVSSGGITITPSTPSFSGTVVLDWDAPASSTNVNGYKIYYGDSGNYTDSVDIGNSSSYTFENLTGTTCFAVTTYNSSGTESGYSNEVCAS
ncbi:hypothetical protein H8E50_08525 [bacterium]|nr:hypothetical protein [bacterium]